MPALPASRALLQFVDDEMLRAPLLFDQLVEGTLEHARKSMALMAPVERAVTSDMLQELTAHQAAAAERFMKSLRGQVAGLLEPEPRPVAARPVARTQPLTLVDDEAVALEVELSHAIQAIKDCAEYELLELQTYTAALVGDMDMSADHNPFSAEAYARALWAAAQAIPQRSGLQLSFMRHASPPLAQLLRRSYAASSSRLESMGVEPASYRTVVLPSGSWRNRRHDSVHATNLQQSRPILPMSLDLPQAAGSAPPRAGPASADLYAVDAPAVRPHGRTASGVPQRREAPPLSLASAPGLPPLPEPVSAARSAAAGVQGASAAATWRDVAQAATTRADRQAIELVSRLFDALTLDERLPRDVGLLVSRLHGPAMRLALRDPGLLDKGEHPLWRFVNRLAFATEMAPDPGDPERQYLLKVAQGTIDQLASEPEQSTGLYRWALERLEAQLTQRLQRRLAVLATRIGALQKLEDRLVNEEPPPTTLQGTLDVPQLDTVPAQLLDDEDRLPSGLPQGDVWLALLRTGDWLRLYLQGRWVQAQLLWTGERREIWLLGDGASDQTWAVRRNALVTLYARGLLKTLVQRSIVAAAAARVREQVSTTRRAGAA